MDTATVIELARQALWITVLVSAPLLVVALVVGVTVGIFQAATSINEMTLSLGGEKLAKACQSKVCPVPPSNWGW